MPTKALGIPTLQLAVGKGSDCYLATPQPLGWRLGAICSLWRWQKLGDQIPSELGAASGLYTLCYHFPASQNASTIIGTAGGP